MGVAMAIVERKFTFAGTRVELLLLLENESDQRYADFMQQRHGVRASDVWLLSPQWRGRGRLVKTLDSLCFDQLSSWRAVDVPEDVLALQREGKTVELTFGGPPRGPVTVTAVCHHESFMPWFRVVLRLLGQEEEESNEISASAPLPAPAAPLPANSTPDRPPTYQDTVERATIAHYIINHHERTQTVACDLAGVAVKTYRKHKNEGKLLSEDAYRRQTGQSIADAAARCVGKR